MGSSYLYTRTFGFSALRFTSVVDGGDEGQQRVVYVAWWWMGSELVEVETVGWWFSVSWIWENRGFGWFLWVERERGKSLVNGVREREKNGVEGSKGSVMAKGSGVRRETELQEERERLEKREKM